MSEVTASRRRLIVAALLLVLFVASLDQTIVSTALSSIVGDLGGLEHLSWVVTAYLLASTIVGRGFVPRSLAQGSAALRGGASASTLELDPELPALAFLADADGFVAEPATFHWLREHTWMRERTHELAAGERLLSEACAHLVGGVASRCRRAGRTPF